MGEPYYMTRAELEAEVLKDRTQSYLRVHHDLAYWQLADILNERK